MPPKKAPRKKPSAACSAAGRALQACASSKPEPQPEPEQFDFFEGYKRNTVKKSKEEIKATLKKRIAMFKKIEATLPREQVEKFGKSKSLENVLRELELKKK